MPDAPLPLPEPPAPSRRTVLRGAAAAGALAASGYATDAYAADGRRDGGYRLTVLGTTDLHGNVLNWDYFKNAEYDDSAHNDIGLAKVSTLVSAMRGERGAASTLLIDAGDTIQGTPLAYYYAKINPITEGATHPMATAMNTIGYDAAALGNHEFNYGIPLLRKFDEQVDFPLLGANAIDSASGLPAFPPYVLRKVDVGGPKRVTVGILGLTNPGIAIWDKTNVEGKMEFPGLVSEAKRWVPKMRAAGAEVVIVAAHSGATTSSSYGDALPYVENASSLVARRVPGIDAILVGHAHVEIAERFVTNKETGRPVLLTEPLRWGMRLSVIDIDLRRRGGRWEVMRTGSQVLNANTVEEDGYVAALLGRQHRKVVHYVNSPVGESTEAMSAATARFEDVAALDFINYVQSLSVQQGIAGTEYADLPVLSIAAPFNRDAAIPEGTVSVRDVAGLYIFDNTLLGIVLTGAQVKDYLEKSAEYFQPVTSAGPHDPDDITNAVTPTAPGGTPDYNYDVMGGLDAPLTYEIDLGRAVGDRIVGLQYDGADVPADQEYVIAINNYRQSGGGSFPHVVGAPVVDNRQQEIRQLLIDWVGEQGTVDPATFASIDWLLTYQGTPLEINGATNPAPSPRRR